MVKNSNLDYDGFDFIFAIGKIIRKHRKILFINIIFVSLVYTFYLNKTKSFKNNYELAKEILITKKEIPLSTGITDIVNDDKLSCRIFDKKSVYDFAKSNYFLNFFSKQINSKFGIEKETFLNNFVIENLNINNSFMVKFKNTKIDNVNSVLNHYQIVLNETLEKESSNCNKILAMNTNYYINRLKTEDLKKIFINNPSLANVLTSYSIYNVEFPINSKRNSFAKINKISMQSTYIYVILLLFPLIYLFVYYKLNGFAFNEQSYKSILPYRYIDTLSNSNQKLNKIIIQNTIDKCNNIKNLGVCDLTKNNNGLFVKLLEELNLKQNIISIDPINISASLKIDKLIIIVSPFELTNIEIKENISYLDKYNDLTLGFFFFD